MQSLDVMGDSQCFSQLLSQIEARFSIEIDACRQDAFRDALSNYASTLGGTLETIEYRARAGLLESEHWSTILHLATNHETRFFRSPPAIAQVLACCKHLKSPKILSVGCSTGEEPYSIATALLGAGHASFRIHGTDISGVCIKTAEEGTYSQHPGVGHLAAVQLPNQKMKFHAWVRSMVTFEKHNILQDNPVRMSQPDVIITQNMLIYYRQETRHEILNRLASMLGIGGVLITGPTEAMGWELSSMRRLPNHQLNVFERS